MSIVFELNHASLAADPQFAGLAEALAAQPKIDSRASFNRYCREACRLWEAQFPAGIGETTAKYAELVDEVSRGGDQVIPTSWGGVVVTVHEHPRVEKYLVIRKGGYLALETHEEKDERLEVQEGAGLILCRRTADEPLTVQALVPGAQFHFLPRMEHCIIGTENLLVFERSIDPKGMDKDLVFIFEPDLS